MTPSLEQGTYQIGAEEARWAHNIGEP
jgi:hypothetical protein